MIEVLDSESSLPLPCHSCRDIGGMVRAIGHCRDMESTLGGRYFSLPECPPHLVGSTGAMYYPETAAWKNILVTPDVLRTTRVGEDGIRGGATRPLCACGANLEDWRLDAGDYSGSMFVGSRLAGVNAGPDSDFADSSFRGASLRNVSFRGCSLRGVELTGALMDGCSFDECDLRGVRGIETAKETESVVLDRCSMDDEFRVIIELRGADMRGLS